MQGIELKKRQKEYEIATIWIRNARGRKIPELMKGLGKGVKSFKEGMNEIDIDEKKEQVKKDE